MIFPSLSLETTLQVEDKTRLDASLSFISNFNEDEITDVLIEPESGAGFVSVFNTDKSKWYLDYAYVTQGNKVVTCQVNTTLNPTGRTRNYNIEVITEEDDCLFSSDGDLYPYEPQIVNYLPRGKNSYKYAHRKAQEKIINYLDEQRIWHEDGSRYTKQEIALLAQSNSEIKEQFRFWSTFETLLIIFESNQVSNQDIFQEKKEEYMSMRNSARKRSALRLDQNKDGVIDDIAYDIRSLRMIRR
jgi:hypothetical protein